MLLLAFILYQAVLNTAGNLACCRVKSVVWQYSCHKNVATIGCLEVALTPAVGWWPQDSVTTCWVWYKVARFDKSLTGALAKGWLCFKIHCQQPTCFNPFIRSLRVLVCRVWAALQSTTRTMGLVIIWKKTCLCHMGTSKAADYVPGQATAGPICEKAIASGMGNYLPNLVLYPGMCACSGWIVPWWAHYVSYMVVRDSRTGTTCEMDQ